MDWTEPSCGLCEIGMKPYPARSCGAEDAVDRVVESEPSLKPIERVRLLDWLLLDIGSVHVLDDRWMRVIGSRSIDVILVAERLRDAAGSGSNLSEVTTLVLGLIILPKTDSFAIVGCPVLYGTYWLLMDAVEAEIGCSE